MRRRRRITKGNASVTLFTLITLFVLGIYYALTGNSPGGGTPTAIPGRATELSPVVNVPTSANASGSWWEVYFTDPLNVKNPDQWQDSIEGRIIEKINAAQTSIHIASFEFDLTPVAQALIEAKQRGVDVRWVTDNENGIDADTDPGRGQFAMLKNAGIEVRADTRSGLMHNKFWIFDGRIVWTGSTNITVSGIFQQNNNVVVIRSPDVAGIYEREFAEMWDGQFGPKSPSTAGQQSVVVNGTSVQVYFSPEDDVMNRIIPIVRGAQSSVRFLAFSFTDQALGQAMIDRAGRGVDVSGVFEKVGSETESSDLRALFCAKVPARQDGNPKFLHDKLIVVDNRTLITGSFNFSNNATDNNDENVVIIDSPDIANLYTQEFDRVWALATDPNPANFTCQ